jgi:hypothetical protein
MMPVSIRAITGLNDSLVRRCGSEKGQRAVAPRARNFRVLGRFRFCVRLSFCRELSLCDAPETRMNRGEDFSNIYKKESFCRE